MISVLYEDRKGFLWAGTTNAGLNRFNPSMGQVTRYRHRAIHHDLLPLLKEYVAAGGRLVMDMPSSWYDAEAKLLATAGQHPVRHALGSLAARYTCEGALVYRLAAPQADHYFFSNDGPATAVGCAAAAGRLKVADNTGATYLLPAILRKVTVPSKPG
ncbi:MAG: hypothetical protein ICV83_01840 [Cytophagales bacterium]|nr:hypothetical protein [Cytophagales bacterium]